MHFNSFVAASLPILGALAAPKPQGYYPTSSSTSSYSPLPVETERSTTYSPLPVETEHSTTYSPLPVETEHSTTYSPLPVETEHSTAPAYSTSSSAPITTPSSAFGIMSARSGSPIHLLPVVARGFRLFLGGETASYCPDSVVENCPAGNQTVFSGVCSMDVEVPGGQQIYISPDGSIGYTQAHSASRPQGANLCPLSYTKNEGETRGYVGLNPATSYGATALVACPAADGQYQLFANLKNATVPQGDVTQCLGFQALAYDYSGDVGAWQYT